MLFTEERDVPIAFYEVFLLSQTIYDDDDSVAFQIGEVKANLLRARAMPEVIELAKWNLQLAVRLYPVRRGR